jgi:hypothetical protein
VHSGRCAAAVLAAVAAVAALAVPAVPAGAAGGTSDEIHYTFTGATSVAFDWRGTATSSTTV